MTKPLTLLIGANSDIAKALALVLSDDSKQPLLVISRDCSFYQQQQFEHVKCVSLKSYSSSNIAKATQEINEHIDNMVISRVFIFHGVLHQTNMAPEKRLEDFNLESFAQVINANTTTPMLWLQHLTPLMTGKHQCKVTIFSARVGSISDNKLGGWYSYRASKAALNMLLKSAAIELSRRAKNIKLIAFHPGTTDTKLSQPFQRNVPQGKLFDCHFVAKQLLSVTEQQAFDNDLSYVDWQGKPIPF